MLYIACNRAVCLVAGRGTQAKLWRSSPSAKGRGNWSAQDSETIVFESIHISSCHGVLAVSWLCLSCLHQVLIHKHAACTSEMEPFPPGTTYPLKDWEREGKLNIELVGYGWWISVSYSSLHASKQLLTCVGKKSESSRVFISPKTVIWAAYS